MYEDIVSQSSPPTTYNLKTVTCIVGPTSVGKSALAAELASHLHGEVVGVDAFQLYRGLSILTAQSEINNVPQHLVGVLDPSEECDAMRYRSMALPIISDIETRGKLPLLVGGTGFYLKALLSPLDQLPPANFELRAQLATRSHEELLIQLKQLDPEAPHQLDIHNRRRVERALEILLLTQKPLAEIWKKKNSSTIPHRGIFLVRDQEDLHQRIEKNVHAMFDQGVLEEVAALTNFQLEHLKNALSRTASMTLGLREIQAHLRGELSLATTIASIIQATKRYAKRQMTWFRNQHNFSELSLTRFSSLAAAAEAALSRLKAEG